MNTRLKIRTFTALLLITIPGVSQPAMPMLSETTPASTAVQSLTQEEREFLMGEINQNQDDHFALAYLSQKEMRETEGKSGPVGAIVNGIGAAAGYIGHAMVSGTDITMRGLIGTTLGGAIIGFIAGPSGSVIANSIFSSQLGFYGGLAAGACSSSCHSAHAATPASEK